MAVTSRCCRSYVKHHRSRVRRRNSNPDLLRRQAGIGGVAAMLVAVAIILVPGAVAAFESGRASFALEINDDLVVPYRVFAIYVLPGEQIDFRAPLAEASANAGTLEERDSSLWHWVAPAEPGLASINFSTADDAIRLNVLVLHPADRIEDGRLYDYRVGNYPEPLDGNPVYEAPDGFIELTPELLDTQVSPHFTLRQFPSKQSTDYPKFLVLRESLLLKLELLLERLNEAGHAADSFTVMSGFRTPQYNRAIGNGQHSRHIYGGAADIYVDVAPRDDIMDDLNGDGTYDYRDAQWLYRLADELFGKPELAEFRGGLGVYRSNDAHGPFLHVDARGRRARWGLLP